MILTSVTPVSQGVLGFGQQLLHGWGELLLPQLLVLVQHVCGPTDSTHLTKKSEN